jgi:hypothetical protein
VDVLNSVLVTYHLSSLLFAPAGAKALSRMPGNKTTQQIRAADHGLVE